MYIELKIEDSKVNFFLEFLNAIKDGVVQKIDIRERNLDVTVDNFINLQIGSLSKTWDNSDDKAWDDL